MGKLLNRTARAQTGPSFSQSTLATIYGCCGLFDLCGDADLMSLSLEGTSKLLDWIGWERTSLCKIIKNFITYTAPSGTAAGEPTSSVVSNPCASPETVEFGTCDFTLEDFGRLREAGPVRDITEVSERLCERQPMYRLDGTPITDDMEFDMRMALEVVLQDAKRLTVTGNHASGGQWDGLEQLVKTGYTDSHGHHCTSMDSNVIDWNANDLDGGAGITWNGAAVGATYDFVDVLLAAFRRSMQRIGWSPTLAAQTLNVGDVALVLPSAYVDCVLNFYTCWRVCPGEQYNENNLNSIEARRFRDSLMGGKFGAGKIYLHGFEIPLLPHDWGLIKGPTRFDAYLLFSNVGNVKVMQGQYLDLATVPAKSGGLYDVTDGGKFLTWLNTDQTCYERVIEFRPRMLSWAPFLQTRFQDLKCAQPGPILSPDPQESSSFPESSMSVAVCP